MTCRKVYVEGSLGSLSYVGDIRAILTHHVVLSDEFYVFSWKLAARKETESGPNYGRIIIETGREILPEYYSHPVYGEVRMDDGAAIRYTIKAIDNLRLSTKKVENTEDNHESV